MAKVTKKEVKAVVTHEYVVTLSEEEFAVIAVLLGRLGGINKLPRKLANQLWDDCFGKIYGTELFSQFSEQIKGSIYT